MALLNYTMLVANKGTVGSIADYVSYTKLTTSMPVILDEAQSLIYSILRCREMRTRKRFTANEGDAWLALPADFLDPIGDIKSISRNYNIRLKDESFIKSQRSYERRTGSLAINPFTTTSGSTRMSVTKTNHDVTVDSAIYMTGAAAVGGIDPNGTFDVVAITDANTMVIETGQTATLTTFGGGGAVSYEINRLNHGAPAWWAVWDDRINFNSALDDRDTYELYYFKKPAPLSASNLTNFLTSRYPGIIREACLVSAASFMKDDGEYSKHLEMLKALVERASVENDLMWRGAEIFTETP